MAPCDGREAGEGMARSLAAGASAMAQLRMCVSVRQRRTDAVEAAEAATAAAGAPRAQKAATSLPRRAGERFGHVRAAAEGEANIVAKRTE